VSSGVNVSFPGAPNNIFSLDFIEEYQILGQTGEIERLHEVRRIKAVNNMNERKQRLNHSLK